MKQPKDQNTLIVQSVSIPVRTTCYDPAFHYWNYLTCLTCVYTTCTYRQYILLLYYRSIER